MIPFPTFNTLYLKTYSKIRSKIKRVYYLINTFRYKEGLVQPGVELIRSRTQSLGILAKKQFAIKSIVTIRNFQPYLIDEPLKYQQ